MSKTEERKALVVLDTTSYERDFHYYSNSCGNLFRGDEDIEAESLPKELQRAFAELWEENQFGLNVYLAEYRGAYGISLEAGYDDCTAGDFGMTREKFDSFAFRVALLLTEKLPGVQILYGKGVQKWSDGTRDTIVMAFVPWDTDRETYEKIGTVMGETVYANITPPENAGENPPLKLGDHIRIIYMNGEPQYCGKSGTVNFIDDMGQVFGTWGGCAIHPEEDVYEIIDR